MELHGALVFFQPRLIYPNGPRSLSERCLRPLSLPPEQEPIPREARSICLINGASSVTPGAESRPGALNATLLGFARSAFIYSSLKPFIFFSKTELHVVHVFVKREAVYDKR